MSLQIVIHQATASRLKDFLAKPSQTLILAAPTGSGKTALALWVISQVTGQPSDKLTSSPNLRLVSPSGQSISIDEIRALSQFLKLKTTGAGELRRFIIVEQADHLTLEAQNAFLKLLEEPPADTLIILTVSNPKALLSTVVSRAQIISAKLPTKKQLAEYFKLSIENFENLYNISRGRPGLLAAMINGDQAHPLIEAIKVAKHLLSLSKFEQLSQIDELTKRRDDNAILEALQLIADRGLIQAAGQNNLKLMKRWQKILNTTYGTKADLQKGAQTKLALTNLILNL